MAFAQEEKRQQKEKDAENPPDLLLDDSNSDSDADQDGKNGLILKSKKGDKIKTPEYKEEKRRKNLLKRAEKLKVQSDKLMAESRRAAQQYDQYIKAKAKVSRLPYCDVVGTGC